MKFQNPLLLITALLATGIHAGCFSGGESWAKDEAPKAIATACHRLAGSYAGHQSKEVEIKVPHQCYYFRLNHITDGVRNIDKAECQSGMLKEYTGCDHGGKSAYTNWEYTADPNKSCRLSSAQQFNLD